MNVFYVSPSVMPSRSANSVHVARMCEALTGLGHHVTLCMNRSMPEEVGCRERLEVYYGVKLGQTTLVSFYTRFTKAINIRIAWLSLLRYWSCRKAGMSVDLMISRNLYAAYLLRWFTKSRVVFETHQREQGFRGWMQQRIIQDPRMGIVVISHALARSLSQQSGVKQDKLWVLPDAAPQGHHRMTTDEKRRERDLVWQNHDSGSYRRYVGYFGHLCGGRGIDLIRELAKRHPTTGFFLFGGREADIAREKARPAPANFKIQGFIAPGEVMRMMSLMDVLVMPYETEVSIGAAHANTTQWMSPMKMFEYMATGVPLIASKLPVLEEVLSHESNSLLAKPADANDWSSCLQRLENDSELSERIADTAYDQYKGEHNWTTRAAMVLQRAVG